jgi:peptide/nickel transport system substrate-binding protein
MRMLDRIVARIPLRWLLATLLLAAACGPASSPSPTTGGPQSGPGGQAGAAAGQRTRLTVVLGSEPLSIHPYGDSASFVYGMWMHMLEPLVIFNPETGQNDPVLAVSWSTPDPHTWEFKLRQGVRFHDGGEFTAEDVVHSYGRIRDDPGSAQRSTLAEVEHVEAVDRYTVRVRTKTPDASLIYKLNNRVIASKAHYDQLGPEQADRTPVGTGPYVFKEWVQGQRWVIERNPNYWGTEHRATVDEVVFRWIKEPQAAVTALLNGEVDIIPNVPPQLVDRVANSPNTQIASARGSRIMFLGMNVNFKPWDNQKVRQAVAYAIDREGIIRGVLGGRAYELKGAVGPGQYAYDPELRPVYSYDAARARQLLAEAGYPNGVDVEIQSSSGRFQKDKEITEAIVAMLGQVGIRARHTTPEWGKFWPDIQRGQVPFYFFGRGSVEDPSEYLHQYFRTGVTPRIAFSDPEVDAVLLAEQQEFDPAKRIALLRRAMSLINETAPAVFLFQYEDTYGASKRLNFKARGDEYVFAWNASLK